MLWFMSVTVILELKFKPESVATAREVFGRALKDTRHSPGNIRTDVLVDETDEGHWLIYELWESVEADEAYRAFRAGEGKLTEVPSLVAAPPGQEPVHHQRRLTSRSPRHPDRSRYPVASLAATSNPPSLRSPGR